MTTPEGISLWGLVETRWRNYVDKKRPLSEQQEALAEQIFRLASMLDVEMVGNQAATLSRELRQVVAQFREAEQPAEGADGAPKVDPGDEVAERRRKRRGA